MEFIKIKIAEIIRFQVHGCIIANITEKEDGLRVIVQAQSKVEASVVNKLEQDASVMFKMPVTLYFIYDESMQQKKRSIQPKIKQRIGNINKVIMICSGKGGVGKSTISANIAYFLMLAGYKVGLFDADIYGPSIQMMFGIKDELKIKDGMFIPHIKYNIKLMSMGFIIQSDDALVWRGPMITKTLNQMLLHTDWSYKKIFFNNGDLDFLIIDTPPGTGDVHLSIAENYIIDGAIIVSTPQQNALKTAHRSLDMLQKLDIKILGLIENMTYVLNADSSKYHLFGEGNVEQYSIAHQIPLLAQIPLIPEMVASLDCGKLDAWQYNNIEATMVFKELIKALIKILL